MKIELKPFIERGTELIATPTEETEKIEMFSRDNEKIVQIKLGLQTNFKRRLVNLLTEYLDIFAWTPADMLRIDRNVVVHKLSVNPNLKSIKQIQRNIALECQKVINEEINKLLVASFIFKIDYLKWLGNMVLVKKHNGKWRMHVDYTDLDKVCPKDYYSLPSIDKLIDSTSGHTMLSFINAFSEYNQISMHTEDILKTAFITHRAIYVYKVMSVDPINVGATYQHMMNKVFKEHIGKNMKVSIDDMIVRIIEIEDHLSNLKECFQNIQYYNMRLNPTKCTFDLGSGKFLGYMVSKRGNEANLKKISAILNMKLLKM